MLAPLTGQAKNPPNSGFFDEHQLGAEFRPITCIQYYYIFVRWAKRRAEFVRWVEKADRVREKKSYFPCFFAKMAIRMKIIITNAPRM